MPARLRPRGARRLARRQGGTGLSLLRAIALRDEDAAFVAAGGREVALSSAGERPSALRPGEWLSLGGGGGVGIADLENDRLRVMIAPGEPFERPDASFFGARVEAALERRRALGLVQPEAAYRLLNGAGDGVPGLVADVYGGWAVLHAYGRSLVPSARTLATVLIGGAELQGVVVKLRGRGAAARGEVAQEIHGAPPPPRLVVEERGLRFEVHLTGGLNVGLFTDMREERARLASLASGRGVLNGFSYTGSLSVAAAVAGATAVTSVDLSGGVQRWARDNFRLNGLDPSDARYRFPAADVARHLAQEARQGRRHDLVLLDPPAFSAARGAGFAIDRDYPALVASASALLPEGGLLWLACNARRTSLADLWSQGLAAAGRQATLIEEAGLPADHPTLAAQPEDRYLQVALLRLA